MAQDELEDLKPRVPQLEEKLKLLLLPKDPADDKDIIMEFRPGAGGDEAELFCAQLVRMYLRYAERQGWRAEVISSQDTGIGGMREAQLSIKATGAYSATVKLHDGVVATLALKVVAKK
jgi:peptide chain release factor 1